MDSYRVFEAFWNRYYWVVMALALVTAIFTQLPTAQRGDYLIDAAFAFWTLLTYLFSGRWPKCARFAHALGVILILALYAHTTETHIPPELRPYLYILFVFFPIYTAAAMGGLGGFAAALLLAVSAGYDLLHATPQTAGLTVLFWGLAGLVGYGYYRLAQLLAEQYRKMEALALSDPLTGLGNRRALEQDFARYRELAARENARLVLTLWDINDLKKMNDRFGHDYGDRMLREFARALLAAGRKSDPFYRIGGDEFAGLHIGLQHPQQLIQRVRKEASWVSAGWVDATSLDFDEAYRRADRKMYDDKATKPETYPDETP
ncbi:GGDEF domain-containing protein [Oceanithermus sp.]